MKLIDILIEELPKRGGWPDDSDEMCQSRIDCEIYTNSKLLPDFYVGERAEDNGIDNGVTREQYEAALADKNDGWIEWGGGECPVEKGTLVDVRYRDSQEYPDRIGVPALVYGGYGATYHHWLHDGMMNGIISYRQHKPQEAEQAKADDEAELNERIKHDASTVWNGEGLPPVGCFCEVEDIDGMLVYGHGESGEVIAHVENTAVIRMSYGLGCFKAGFLRPLRTEAERKRDAVVEQMIKIATIYTTKSLSLDLALNSIYNAIAAGEITGVKLED